MLFSFLLSGESSKSYWPGPCLGSGAGVADKGRLGRDRRDLLLRAKEGAGSDVVVIVAVSTALAAVTLLLLGEFRALVDSRCRLRVLYGEPTFEAILFSIAVGVDIASP